MPTARKTLRLVDDLIAAGLVPAGRRGELERVAGRYALALHKKV